MNEIDITSTPRNLPLPGGPPHKRPADLKLWGAVGGFYEIFMSQFVKTMRRSDSRGELLEEAAGRQVFDEMFSEALARKMAEGGSLGLRREIYRELGGRFETADAPDKRAEKNDAS